MNSKELNRNKLGTLNAYSAANENSEVEKKDGIFSIPNEASCSFEFSEGCIFSE